MNSEVQYIEKVKMSIKTIYDSFFFFLFFCLEGICQSRPRYDEPWDTGLGPEWDVYDYENITWNAEPSLIDLIQQTALGKEIR